MNEMVETTDERAGGLWRSISAPNLLCDNCHKELPANAEIGKGKHAVADLKKQRVAYYCNTCYYYYKHRNDPDIKEKKKLR
jgi:hypothetical protein